MHYFLVLVLWGTELLWNSKHFSQEWYSKPHKHDYLTWIKETAWFFSLRILSALLLLLSNGQVVSDSSATPWPVARLWWTRNSLDLKPRTLLKWQLLCLYYFNLMMISQSVPFWKYINCQYSYIFSNMIKSEIYV